MYVASGVTLESVSHEMVNYIGNHPMNIDLLEVNS